MIQMRTILDVADNSGARKISMILPLGGSTGRYAGLGDIITANVKESAPDAPEPVKKGKVVRAVIVRCASVDDVARNWDSINDESGYYVPADLLSWSAEFLSHLQQ